MISIGVSPLNSISVSTMVELAQKAEHYGFTHFWLPDEKWMRSPWQNASAIVRNTKTISAGLSCANTIYRHPVVIAYEAQTLSESAGGRAMISLCLGSHHAIHQIGKKWVRPLKNLEESASIIGALLQGDPVNYQGELFTVNDIALGFKAPKIPVLLSGGGPKTIQLASRIADGIVLDDVPLRALNQVMEWIDEGLAASGRSRSEFFIANLMSFGIKTPDYDGVSGAKFFSVWQVGTQHKYIQESMQEYSQDMADVRNLLPDQPAAAKKMTDEVFSAFGITGSPRECIQQLRDYEKIGVNHIAMMMPYGIPQARTIDIVGSHVVQKNF